MTSTDEIADDLMLHLCEAQNNGALRSMISVYRPRSPEFDGFRIWNQQLIRFAGFRRERFGNQVVGEPEWQTSREIIGDPVSVELTEIALGLGWKPEQIHGFEPLPLIVQSPRACPEWYPIPKQNILTVKLSHPDYEWFESLDLEWYALPMVSNMLLEIGGVEYPAAPFSGWYMSTEIALRNLTDRERYDLLSVVADHLGLDTKSGRTLWKDKASVVIHEAVLTSFEAAGVKIVDHHTASRDFMKFAEQEQRANRDVFANWRWIVPPTSGSLTDVFHTKWRDEIVSPNFFYQSDPWKHSVEEPRAPRQDCPEASSSKTLNPVRKCPFH